MTDSIRRAINPELDARIAATKYTEEERANIETMIRFRGLERPFRREDLRNIIAKDYSANHHGMDALIKLTGIRSGYTNESIADRQDTIIEIIAKGDRVWAYFKMEGHHTGTLFGQEATGKPVSMHELAILRFNDEGLIVEASFFGDELELAMQVGLVPTANLPGEK